MPSKKDLQEAQEYAQYVQEMQAQMAASQQALQKTQPSTHTPAATQDQAKLQAGKPLHQPKDVVDPGFRDNLQGFLTQMGDKESWSRAARQSMAGADALSTPEGVSRAGMAGLPVSGPIEGAKAAISGMGNLSKRLMTPEVGTALLGVASPRLKHIADLIGAVKGSAAPVAEEAVEAVAAPAAKALGPKPSNIKSLLDSLPPGPKDLIEQGAKPAIDPFKLMTRAQQAEEIAKRGAR